MPAIDPNYPGADATPQGLCSLADAYRAAAAAASAAALPGVPHSAAPVRLLSLHAVELYLTSFLLLAGRTCADARRIGHDLHARAEIAAAAGLVLRRRTIEHLAEVGRDREYLAVRYGPERLPRPFHANRLAATLEEIAAKVSAAVAADAGGLRAGTPSVSALGGARPSACEGAACAS